MGHQEDRAALSSNQGLSGPSQGGGRYRVSSVRWQVGSGIYQAAILPKFSSHSRHRPYLLPRPQTQGRAQNSGLGTSGLGTKQWSQAHPMRLRSSASRLVQLLEEEGISS